MLSKLEIYGIILLVVALAMGAAYYKGHQAGAAEVQTKFDLFTAQVNAAGEKARADALAKEKENADKIAGAVADRDNALAKLRIASSRPRGGFVPQPAAGSSDGDRICYSAKALDAALRKLDTGISSLVTEGDGQVINSLTLLKSWPSP